MICDNFYARLALFILPQLNSEDREDSVFCAACVAWALGMRR